MLPQFCSVYGQSTKTYKSMHAKTITKYEVFCLYDTVKFENMIVSLLHTFKLNISLFAA